MTEYNLQASECRKEARSISVRHWSDDEINEKIDLWTAKFHKDTGRTTAWTVLDNQIEYKLAKLAIIKGVASDLMSAIEEMSADAEKKLKEYTDLITELTDNTFIMVSGGNNLADELNPVNYTAVESGTIPDLGIDNGL